MHSHRTHAALAVALAIGLLGHTALASHARTTLFICQTFPQLSVKPLDALASEPEHYVTFLASPHGTIVADLYVPTSPLGKVASRSRAAVVLAMGVKSSPHDRPHLLELARTFGRLGFVVLWPRLQALDEGRSLPEEPRTFVEAVHYVRHIEAVDPARVSLLGISTGASISLIAASSPELTGQVRAVISFGGYYDLSTYLFNLATATVSLNGQSHTWEPSEDAVGHVREILANEGLVAFEAALAAPRSAAAARLQAAPSTELDQLRRFDPSRNPLGFDGRLFILHDTGDPLVPSTQSAELERVATARMPTTYLETSLFEHVQPRHDLSWHTLADALRLYAFVNDALNYL